MAEGSVTYSRFLQVQHQSEQWRMLAEKMFLVAYSRGATEEELKPFFEMRKYEIQDDQ
jgi:hypothetical protein